MSGQTIRCSSRENVGIFLREIATPHVTADHDMDRFSLAKNKAVGLADDAVSELDQRSAKLRYAGLNRKFIVVARRSFIANPRFHNGDAASFRLHFGVLEAVLPHQLHATDLEPDEVVRVIHNPHLVRLRVPNPHPGRSDANRSLRHIHTASLPTTSEPGSRRGLATTGVVVTDWECMQLRRTDVLLVVDVQNDFCPGGALAIDGGDQVVPVINRLGKLFEHLVLTQDWHPSGHISFASAHPGAQPYQTVEANYGTQALWPDHCVQGTTGAALHSGLQLDRAELIVRKGFRRDIDSYSAFVENDHVTPTGLAGYLRERGLTRIFVCGLAYDFCVRHSAIDGTAHDFEAVVIEDACRAVDLPGSVESADKAFLEAGIQRISSDEITNS